VVAMASDLGGGDKGESLIRLNWHLDDVILISTMRKPFDVLAEEPPAGSLPSPWPSPGVKKGMSPISGLIPFP
jgi:hypothetical protein